MALNFGQGLFPVKPGRIIASFDFLNLVEGTGIIKYQLFTTKDSAAEEFNIIADSQSADIITRSASSAGTTTELTFTKVVDVDFDMSVFNNPRDIKGKIYLKFKHALGGTSSDIDDNGYSIIKIRKWDGSTETELDSTQTETINQAGTVTEMMVINISKKHFKIGENLRITIEGWAQIGGGGGNSSMTINHNPASAGNEFFIWLPFQTDL